MPFFTNPTSFRSANPELLQYVTYPTEPSYPASSFSIFRKTHAPPHSSHPALGHLILLVFEAVLEVVCVSLPGYIVARQGMFDVEMQKFTANLNVALFTPCLIFTKLASQLNASKLADLAVIPVIFAVQTIVSYICAVGISRVFSFNKRPRNFVVAMGVFGNSNSLPISLVVALSQTLKGLHWDKVPGDNDDEVAARGILYLLIFQQLGQLVRWSWGYHVLLAPPETFEGEDEFDNDRIESGRYRDDSESDEEPRPLLGSSSETVAGSLRKGSSPKGRRSLTRKTGKISPNTESDFESGEETPVTTYQYGSSMSSRKSSAKHLPHLSKAPPGPLPTPANGDQLGSDESNGNITSFPSIGGPNTPEDDHPTLTLLHCIHRTTNASRNAAVAVSSSISTSMNSAFQGLPTTLQHALSRLYRGSRRFLGGLWAFMNPPLWAMLAAIVVASIPSLQRLFFTEGTFLQNSVTRAVSQSGGVAIPLILVVLGANLANNTAKVDVDGHRSIETDKLEKRLLVASIISRMLLPFLIMAPMLALAARYVPISILDDPIFVIVCFLLTGAPSALQLAQICQINGVYEGVMSRLLFQSYVIWILPSTLVLVMTALEVVEWAKDL